jgi:tetratricopeptide (TPR) repeat protein
MLETLRRLLFGSARAAPPAAVEPPDAHALLQAPRQAYAEGRKADAAQLLVAVLQAHPDLSEAHLLLGALQREFGETEDARDSYALAAHFAPQSWRPLFNLGLLELEQGRATQAMHALEGAVACSDGNAPVHNLLGAAYMAAGKIDAALEQFRGAVALDPDFAEAHSNLGYVLLRELEDYDGGARHIERAMALGPERPDTVLNWALVLQQRGDWDEALALYESLLGGDPAVHQARLNRGLLRLARGDFARGWDDYEARKALPQVRASGMQSLREWDGSDLTGLAIVVYSEQGLGDEIMFASCLPDVLRVARACVVECNPKLVSLFRRSFPQASVFPADSAETPARIAELAVEWRTLAGSLPRVFRNARADFPAHDGYLRADPARVRHWKERLASLPGRRKVGIAWRGGGASTQRSLRSIPLEQWRGVLQSAGVDFISLQYTDCSEEIAQVAGDGEALVHHWREAIDDYGETAALVSALDLVISVQTAMVHLCGALGVATWALISNTPEWRYGEAGETMPWYPTVQLLRKQRGEDWADVLGEVARRLALPGVERQNDIGMQVASRLAIGAKCTDPVKRGS